MLIEDILTAIAVGEDAEWEFKSAQTDVPKNLWESYSAMANTNGGIIILGVEQKDSYFSVSGLTDAAKIRKTIWDCLNNSQKNSVNLLSESDLEIRTIDNKKVAVMRVPRATRRQRPVFINNNPLTGTYRRNYEGDYKCTPDEVKRMLADNSDEPADSRILENFGIADLDDTSIKQYRQRFASLSPDHPWLNEDNVGFLQKLGGWRKERKSGIEGLTVAGLIMFGKMEAIRDPEAIPQFHLDYREIPADAYETRWTDRLTLDGSWAGNIFQFYQRVIQKLSADLKIPFRLDEQLSRKDDTIVHQAVREALVNALIHADYSGQGGVVIQKYPNRFVFSNPGALLLSLEQILFSGGISECRNKSLQLMFQMIGGGEKAGSGMDKILKGWESQNWRSPLIRDQNQPDRVLVILPMLTMLPEQSLHYLNQQFGDELNNLNSIEIQALVTAHLEGEVTNVRLQNFSYTHSSDLTKMLQNLVRKKFLCPRGQGRWTRYTLPNSPHNQIDSLYKQGDSLHNQSYQSSEGAVSQPFDCIDNSPHSLPDSLHSLNALPAVELESLNAIAYPAQNSDRLPPEQTRQIILQLCQKYYLTAQMLGELMNRNSDGIRDRFLSSMVEEGLLQRLYPDKPNRPDQAYKSVSNA